MISEKGRIWLPKRWQAAIIKRYPTRSGLIELIQRLQWLSLFTGLLLVGLMILGGFSQLGNVLTTQMQVHQPTDLLSSADAVELELQTQAFVWFCAAGWLTAVLLVNGVNWLTSANQAHMQYSKVSLWYLLKLGADRALYSSIQWFNRGIVVMGWVWFDFALPNVFDDMLLVMATFLLLMYAVLGYGKRWLPEMLALAAYNTSDDDNKDEGIDGDNREPDSKESADNSKAPDKQDDNKD